MQSRYEAGIHLYLVLQYLSFIIVTYHTEVGSSQSEVPRSLLSHGGKANTSRVAWPV